MRTTLLFILLALGAAHAALADTPLQSGKPASFGASGIAAGYAVLNAYLDVDANAKSLSVNVAASGGDVDLFVRYGTPFPADSNVTEDLLNRTAHYHSISATSNESIMILPSGRVPLQAGRWYIAVINGGTSNSIGTLTATASTTTPVGNITLDFGSAGKNCDQTFWTDSTAATPVGGNNGTTLGQQRQNALNAAAQQLVQQLQIPVNLTVHACGEHLGGDDKSAILAHAAPLNYIYDDASFPINALPKKYTWYSITAAVRLNGSSACGLAGGPCTGVDGSGTPYNEEIEATFNSDIGSPNIIGGEKFYYGLDSAPGGSHQLDFITIAMHEMTHGLGFFGLVNMDATQGPVGAKAGITVDSSGTGSIAFKNFTYGPYDDIYDDSIAIINATDTGYTPFLGYEVNGANDAVRAAALVSGPIFTDTTGYNPGTQTGLRWSDPIAAGSSANANAGRAAPDNFPSLYAPCDQSKTTTCATQPASTLSHTIQPGDMMNAYYSKFNLRNMGLAVPMLAPGGWSNAAATMPVWGQTIPSNWFDSAHSGHGFDFQLAAHDAVHGDVYFLTFYTYASDGTPEWYQAVGNLVDGVFLPGLQSNGQTLYRVHYAGTAQGQLNPVLDSVTGSVIVDFNQAANAPACRNADRSGASLMGLMTWTIGTDTSQWCMQPIVALADHASPDFNGHWFAPNDGGWGFELLDVKDPAGGAAPLVFAYVYYPGPNGQPTWALASGKLDGNGVANMDLLQVSNGYCRTCQPTSIQTAKVGTFSIALTASANGAKPTGIASIAASYPGGAGGFNRLNDSITTLSTLP